MVALKERVDLATPTSHKARMPSGVAAIRRHLRRIDNVPLLVSLFPHASWLTQRALLCVFQSHGQLDSVVGSAMQFDNVYPWAQAQCAVSLTPALRLGCWLTHAAAPAPLAAPRSSTRAAPADPDLLQDLRHPDPATAPVSADGTSPAAWHRPGRSAAELLLATVLSFPPWPLAPQLLLPHPVPTAPGPSGAFGPGALGTISQGSRDPGPGRDAPWDTPHPCAAVAAGGAHPARAGGRQPGRAPGAVTVCRRARRTATAPGALVAASWAWEAFSTPTFWHTCGRPTRQGSVQLPRPQLPRQLRRARAR